MSQLISAVSRVRALESELLTSSHLDRLIGAADFDEAYNVLDDLGWAEEAAYFRESKDAEGVMEVGMASSRSVFASFQIPTIFSILTVLWDIQNIKLALKSFAQGEDKQNADDLMLCYGSYSRGDIVTAVFDGSALSPLLPMLEKAKMIQENQMMEEFIEKELFQRAAQNARGDRFLQMYIQHAQKILLFKKDSISLSSQELGEKYPLYEEIITSSINEHNSEELDLGKLETAADELMVNFLKTQSLGKIDGYAPLFSYYWRKERNSRVIRSILLAKKTGLSVDEIKSEFINFVV